MIIRTVGLPLILLAAGTLALCLTRAELAFCRPFFGGAYLLWPYLDGEVSELVNTMTPLPSLLLGFGSLGVVLGGLLWPRLRKWRTHALFLTLVLALGPGLLVNGVLKPVWGRPRPEETTPFGGPYDYRPVWEIAAGSHCRSFPSGHAATGFYLMSPAFLLIRTRPKAAAMCGLCGVAYGTSVGITRMMQGQHFPSDILWSAGIVYFTGLILFRLCDAKGLRGQLHFTGLS